MLALLRLGSAVAMCLIVYAGALLHERQLAWTLERNAAFSAAAWLQFFSVTVPDFDRLLATGEVNEAQLETLQTAQAALEVFRFKLFNATGELTFLSDALTGTADTGEPLFVHNSEAAAILRTGVPVVSIQSGTGSPAGPDTYAEVYLPVMTARGPGGVIKAYVDMTRSRAAYEQAFARFALFLAALGSLALAIPTLHWAIAWQETRRKNAILAKTAETEARLAQEMRMIGELNEWLQSSRSQAELFEMVERFLTRMLPACEGEIYAYSNSRDVLDGRAGWAGGAPQPHIHPDDCWSLRRGRSYVFGDSDVAVACGHTGDHDGRPYLCLPLLAHGETIGLLHLKQRKGTTPGQFLASHRLAQLCAEQISMALANVRMHDELQDQSIRDPLTGLFNRRHLTEALRRCMSRAAREGTTVGLLSLDIDHFKKFNDNYGHDAGDMVLRAVGEVLDRTTDGDELACRPGGEEFMLVLPDTDVAEALYRAEAIREQIQAIAIRYGNKTLPSVTASIGIALSPADGSTPLDLMRAADEALYSAKAQGRNRAVLTTLMELEAENPATDDGRRDALEAPPHSAARAAGATTRLPA